MTSVEERIWIEVRCGNVRVEGKRKGEVCGLILCRVSTEYIEWRHLFPSIEFKCDGCRSTVDALGFKPVT